MKKTTLASLIGTVFLVGGGAISYVADQKLKQFYNTTQLNSSSSMGIHHFKTHQQQLGFWGGQVQWSAQLIIDPCQVQPIHIQATDTVRKSLFGYTIHTTFHLSDLPPAVAELLNQHLTSTTKIKWTGKGSTTFNLAPHQFKELANWSLSWKHPIKLSYDFNSSDPLASLRNLSIKTDHLLAQLDNELNVEFTNIRYSSNLPLHPTQLDTGKRALHIKVIDYQNLNPQTTEIQKAFIEKFSLNMAQHIRPETSNFEVLFDVNKAHFQHQHYEHFIADEFQLRFNILDLDTPHLTTLAQQTAQTLQQCGATHPSTLEPHLIALLQQGFKLESNHNQLKLGFGEWVANGYLHAPKFNAQESSNTVWEQILMQSSYQVNVDFNKLFHKNLMQFVRYADQPDQVAKEAIEHDWQNLAHIKHATLEQDKFKYRLTHQANTPITTP